MGIKDIWKRRSDHGADDAKLHNSKDEDSLNMEAIDDMINNPEKEDSSQGEGEEMPSPELFVSAGKVMEAHPGGFVKSYLALMLLVCILMIDAVEGLTEQDKKIAGYAHEAGKGLMIVVNKWDLIEKETNTMRDYERKIKAELLFASYAPVLFVSVLNKLRIYDIIERAARIQDARTMRITTGRLNSIIEDAVMMRQPPSDKGRRLKIYYGTQIGTCPPLFSFSINDRELMHFSYARYIENKIREHFDFEGTSIKFVWNERRGEK